MLQGLANGGIQAGIDDCLLCWAWVPVAGVGRAVSVNRERLTFPVDDAGPGLGQLVTSSAGQCFKERHGAFVDHGRPTVEPSP